MKKLGFECRPIVSGNFAKNKVVKYFNYKIFGNLKNAEYIDKKAFLLGIIIIPCLKLSTL